VDALVLADCSCTRRAGGPPIGPHPATTATTTDPHDALRLGVLASALFLLGVALVAGLLPRAASGESPACPSPLAATVGDAIGDGGEVRRVECESQREQSVLLVVSVLLVPVPLAVLWNLWAVVGRGAIRPGRGAHPTG
jgi:hypothetical protein